MNPFQASLVDQVLRHGPQDSQDRLVLITLASEVNEDGQVAMAPSDLAERTGLHQRTVSRAIDRLIANHWLEVLSSGSLQVRLHTRIRARESSLKTTNRQISSTSLPYKEKGPVEVPYVRAKLSEKQRQLNRQGLAYAREQVGKKGRYEAPKEEG